MSTVFNTGDLVYSRALDEYGIFIEYKILAGGILKVCAESVDGDLWWASELPNVALICRKGKGFVEF